MTLSLCARGLATVALATSLSLSFAAVGFAQTAAKPTAKDLAEEQAKVVATVDGANITVGDLALMMDSLPDQYQQVPLPYIYKQLVERLVDRKLLVAEGKRAGIDQDGVVTRRVAYETEGAIQEVYLIRKVNQLITEEKLKKAYDARVKEFSAISEVKARHILVETEETALEVIKELDGGADFAELAKTKSTGPSAPNGGDLGFFNKGQMVAPFAEAAFSMDKGSYTKTPVKTQFGYHVILVEDTRESEAPAFEELEPELRAQLGQAVVNDLLDNLRTGAKVTYFNPETGKEIAEPTVSEGQVSPQ